MRTNGDIQPLTIPLLLSWFHTSGRGRHCAAMPKTTAACGRWQLAREPWRSLSSQARDSYQTAFAAPKGAHLQVKLDGRLDAGMVAATPALMGPPSQAGNARRPTSRVSSRADNAAMYQVFAAWELLAIPMFGVTVAVAAALLPGRWPARTRVVEVLHAE